MPKQQQKQKSVWNARIHAGRSENLMNHLPELRRLAAGLFVALVLMASVASAETFNSSKWGFSATFPGQSKMSAEPIQTRVGNVTLVNFTYEGETQAFMIALTDYPKGSIDSAENSYNGAIEGFVDGIKGKLRTRSPYKLGNINGFDFLVDGPSAASTQKTHVFHERIFLVGDRLYQILYVGPTGTEQGIAALRFLNSFRLL
jgi:hypothetical protein